MKQKFWRFIIASLVLGACEAPQDDILIDEEYEEDEAEEASSPDSPLIGAEGLADPAATNGACPATQGEYVAVDASLGAHALALTSNGVVWAWGRNNRGQIGIGTVNAAKSKPQPVSGIPTRVLRIAAGENHSLALDESGKVWAWGEGTSGQLGNGAFSASAIPKQVNLAANIVAIAAGGAFSLALDNQGRVWAWGANNYGQLGNGGTVNTSTPKLALSTVGCSYIDAIAAGGEFAAGVSGGQVCTWGRNNRGQLGSQVLGYRASAAVVPGVTGVQKMTAGKEYMIASNTHPYGWGDNSAGQLGKGEGAPSFYSSPIGVGGQWANFRHAEAGATHTVTGHAGAFGPFPPYLGHLSTAGSNGHGQLARTAPDPSRTFDRLHRIGRLVAAGADFTIVVQDTNVRAVGKNSEGQLGDGTQVGTTLLTNVCLP